MWSPKSWCYMYIWRCYYNIKFMLHNIYVSQYYSGLSCSYCCWTFHFTHNMAKGGNSRDNNTFDSSMFQSKFIHCCITSTCTCTHCTTTIDSCCIEIFVDVEVGKDFLTNSATGTYLTFCFMCDGKWLLPTVLQSKRAKLACEQPALWVSTCLYTFHT